MAAAWALVAACAENRERPTVPVSGDLAILSDPTGATITIDGRELAETTPDTIAGIPAGLHSVELFLDAGSNQFFRWSEDFSVPARSLGTLDAALEGGCTRDCPFVVDRSRVVCRFNNVGDTCASFFFGGGVPALQWPGDAGADFGAGGRLLAAAIIGPEGGSQAGDTISTQSFRTAWTGRSLISSQMDGLRDVVGFDYWATAGFLGESLLGLAVEQTIVAVDSAGAEDMLFFHFKVTNVTADPRYQIIYPVFPEGGYTFQELYLGFGLDSDVGEPTDDLGSFDPGGGLGFLYDADFSDAQSGSGPPALVGLLTIEPPAGAATSTGTLWRAEDDWDDGSRHGFAWRILAGRLQGGDPIDDHPSTEFGFVSDVPNDFRLTEGHGPIDLSPGESVELTVALLFAAPVGAAQGTLVVPGDPVVQGRAILDIAQDLRGLAGEAPALWQRYRP